MKRMNTESIITHGTGKPYINFLINQKFPDN